MRIAWSGSCAMISSIGRSTIADLIQQRRQLGEPHHALADRAVPIDLARGIGQVDQLQAITHAAQPRTRILADEHRVGDIIDHRDALVAVALERRHQAVRIGQEGERHVLEVEPGADAQGVRRQLVERAEEIPQKLFLGRGHQRVRLAGTDHHARHLQVAGKLQDGVQQTQRVPAHLLGHGCDVHVDVRHVEAHEAEPLAVDESTQLTARRGVGRGGPKMARNHHQLEVGVALPGQMADTVRGRIRGGVAVGVDGERERVTRHGGHSYRSAMPSCLNPISIMSHVNRHCRILGPLVVRPAAALASRAGSRIQHYELTYDHFAI